MKKFILCLCVLGFASQCFTANAETKRTDKPKKVVVKSDTSKGYIEITVIANK